jgi:SAM-dependent methyltransferase
MIRKDAAFTGSLPEVYERYLGPMLFSPFAEDIAERALAIWQRGNGIHPGGGRVLELAAGTGIATESLARALPEARIDATDLNGDMVSFAASRRSRPAVRWSTADAQALPFKDATFDLVVCQFGAMFFTDCVRAFGEARRTLVAGGTFLFSMWDDIERNEVACVVSDTLASVFPENPPLFLRRTPYGHGRPDVATHALNEAGFSDVACDVVGKRSRAASARDAAIGFCTGTPLHHEIIERDATRLPEALDAVAGAIKAKFGDGPVNGAMQAYVFTAR